MKVFVCISEGGGMLFNKRRQSRDKAVTADITAMLGDGALFITEYSAKLFRDSDASAVAVCSPLESAGASDSVFVEDVPISPFKDKITRLIIYKWNEKYPTDTYIDISPSAEGMRLLSSVDFVGNVHERITREIWER